MLRIKFSYLNLVDLDDPISGNYYFGAEAYDIDGHYWEPRIVDSFSIERFFDVEMDVSNRIRTISVSLDNGDKFFNRFAETGKTLLNSQMSLYYDDGQNKTKHFTGKVSKIDSFGTVVKLTLREIGYEYLENNFPDAQIAYDYYSENGINESWNCIPIHFGNVKSIPVSWVNSYESEYIIGSGPILNVKRIYIDEDDEKEKNLLYDSEAENPQKEYKANDDAKPIYVRIFKGFGYDADGHREVVIDDVGKEGETPDPSDNKFHHESKWGGFAYIQLYSIDDDGYEVPAYPYTKDGGIGQVRVDIEGICELDEDTGEYVMVRNPAKIIKMMFVNPELVSEGECAIGWGYKENQVDFDQAIADCETLGYKIDGSFDSTMQFGEALKQICYHCRGYVIEESEKITLNIDMPKSTNGVPRFDDEGLHGDTCDLTEWSEPSVDEQINRVRLNYDWNLKTGKFDKKPSVNHQSPDWEQNQNYDNWLEDTEHAERIGKWNPQTVEFKMIRDCETAHRLAIYYLRKKSKQLIEAKIVVPSEKAMNLDAGDLIRVMSAQMDWYKETISVDANSGNETRTIDKTEGKLFQITQISKSEENTEISITEYDSSIFAADSANFTAYDVPAPVASKLLPMAPLSVTLTAGYESGSDEFSANNVYVNGTIEYDSEGSKNYAVVQYADLGTTVPTQSDIESASFLTHGMITETTFRINYLMAGHYYVVRVYTANNYGNSSATLSSAILVSGNTNVPPAPTLSHTSETGQPIGYTLTGKTVKLRITLDSSDLSGELAQKFRIYRNGQFIKEELATYAEYQKTSSPLVYWGKYTADSIDLVEQYDASYSYYATCVSKWGIESLPSSTITFSTPEEMDLDAVVQTIENIQADQEAMDERLTAIASDDLITAGEKATIRKEWASVQNKYNKLHPVIIAEPYDFDANPLKSQYGTDYTAYETAYSNLSSYLTNTIAINVNADVEGTGVVSALAEKFNDYVDNELKILADIDECNKLLAQTVSLTCSTADNDAAKVIVSENLKIFDGLRLTVTFANGNGDIANDFSINVKNTASGNNLCGNQLYFKGSRITKITFNAGTIMTIVYDATNDRWKPAESTQLLWSESPTTAGVYDLSHINGGKLYVESVESQSIKANAITAEKINAGAVTTAKLDAGAVTSDKITSNAIIGKTFVTADGVGTIDSSTNKYISGVKFDSNGITAWSEDGKTVEIKNDGSATLTGSITANSGYIGGWTVNANDLSSTDGKVVLNKNGTITLSNTINSVLNTITLDPVNGIKETSGSTVKFQLSQTGKLTATDAEISGQITATSGSIGGWTVGNSDLHNGNMYLDSTGNIRGNYNSTNNTGWRLNADGTANIGKLSVTSTGGISSNQFSIDGTTGNASFSGALSAASGSFSGSLSSASVDTNGLTIGTGTNQIKLNSTDGIKATNFQIATNGDVTMTGSVTATSGKIANWTIDGNNLKSSNLILDGANGAIKSNNYSTGISGWQIKGDGTAEFVNATVSGNITASSGNIGGWTVNQTNLTSNNSKVVLANDGTITLNNASSNPTNIITIDPTNGIKETNNGTVKFQLSQAGKLTATDAEISGKITANDGSIGGWSINSTQIYKNGLYIDSTGHIQGNYVSGISGWKIDKDGTAEFENATIRGTIKSIVFQYETVSAIGGQLLIRPAAKIVSVDTTNQYKIYLENVNGFQQNDIVRVKISASSEYWAKINTVNSTDKYVILDSTMKGGTYSASNVAGITMVNYGHYIDQTTPSNNGGILFDGVSTNSPKIDLFNHSGTFTNGSLVLNSLLRIGNLNGIGGITSNKYGIFIGHKRNVGNQQDNQYLQYDPDSGLQIGGQVRIEGSNTPLNKLDIMNDWAVNEVREGETVTVMNGALIKTHSVAADQMATDAIQSRYYDGPANMRNFSQHGSFFDLDSGAIVTPSFRIDPIDGSAHFSGDVSIESDDVTTNSLDVNGASNFGGNLLPKTTNTYDIGSSTYKWKDAYINNIHGTVDDIKETALSNPTGAILRLSAKGCTTASIANDNGVIDVSGNGHHTKAYGDISVGSDEGGFYFDTNTNGYIAYNNNFNYLSDKFSVRIRFKHIAVSSEGYIFCLNTDSGLTDAKFGIEYNRNVGNGGFQWTVEGTFKNLVFPIDTNIIYDLILTRNTNNEGKLYINGILVDSLNIVRNFTRANLTLGYRSASSNGATTSRALHWQGRIYAFQVFNYDLTETQVKSLYMFPDEALFAQLTADLIGANVITSKNLVKTQALITETAQIDSAIIPNLQVTNGITIGDLNTTAQNASTVANSANSKIDNLQVGGRNLMLGTKDFSGQWNTGGAGTGNRSNWTKDSNTYNGLTIYKREGSWQGLNRETLVEAGKTYTFSVYIKATDVVSTDNVRIYISSSSSGAAAISGGSSENIMPSINSDFKRFSYTFQCTVSGGVRCRVEKSTSTGTIYICGYKLEEGNTPTTWTPAPEDVDTDISTAQTTANGAVTNLNNINLISDSTIHAMFDDLPTFKRYGFIVTQNDVLTDADAMVEYIYDAVGMTPAGLNSSNEFNYGSWETFCNEICKPAMVAPDGSITYELDHSDQTKKLDGTASAYDDVSQSGNMMSVFKRMYISITEPDSTHLKVVISDAKLDETYQAYAFTDENGRKKDVTFFSMFNGIKDSNNKLRSLKSSSQAIYSTSGVTMRTYAQNNGSMWDFPDYSLWNYIQCLLVLISKSLDIKTKFGKGNISGGQSNPSLPGALISTGMFSGTTANETSPVKTFYIENMWGNSWNWVNGLLSYNGNYYLKLTPPYTNSSTSGYSNVGAKPASGSYGTIKAMGNYNGAMLPKTTSGTDYSKWYKSRFYNGYGTSDATVRTARLGGCRTYGSGCSVFYIALTDPLSFSFWSVSARLAGR